MLEIRNLGVRYGAHLALSGVSAKVAKGEICVILGANGAGKSSLLKAVAGIVKSEPGTEIVMNGRPIRGMKPHLVVEQGIALVPEGRGVFGDLTVAENLQLGAFAKRARNAERETLASIYALFPRLAERKRQIVRTMSGGEQQMVAIGRALMSRPDILMLDEPSLGLSPLLSKELFRSLKGVAESGVGILLVEQNARLSLKIADRGYLVENGLVTGEDTAARLMHDPAVVNAYLGGAGKAGARPMPGGIRLPPSFGLPVGLATLVRAAGDLAQRAGAIHAAFVRHLRRLSNLPSAFDGRYDPTAEGDPWERLAMLPRSASRVKRIDPVAARLAGDAADLAARAQERHTAFIRQGRLSVGDAASLAARAQARHTAHVRTGRAGASVEPPGPEQSLDAAALADRAAERLRAHLRGIRAAQPAIRMPPSPPEAPRPAKLPDLDDADGNTGGLIGHNSAGLDLDEEETEARTGFVLDIDSVVARAAAIHSAHVSERRKTLTILTYPAAPEAGGGIPETGPAKKSPKGRNKRKKRKEA